jgi:1-deoxy-D-xylulose-5-phosphate reductoisomerase
MKKVFILGSTGSIGRSTLDVVAAHPDHFTTCALATYQNTGLLAEQIDRFKPEYAVIYDADAYHRFLQTFSGRPTEIKFGADGLRHVVSACRPDIFVNAFVGFAGLQPTIEAIQAGCTVALANKETLVVAGELIQVLLQKHRLPLLPIDSEHSAIWQCLRGEEDNEIERILLTASGGPFRNTDRAHLAQVTPEQALNHPNWKMGKKITIDSATLMNKGLEVIEAHWLYHLPAQKIEVLIHPQSIVHSLVEFSDHSLKAQLGIPDMRIPIQYALSYPRRLPLAHSRMDFTRYPVLTFEQPDFKKFPCLSLAYRALESARSYPAVLNAANEEAVAAFLDRRIDFLGIAEVIESALAQHKPQDISNLEDCISIDRQTRREVFEIIKRKQK